MDLSHPGDSVPDSFERFNQDGARTGNVDALEAFPLGAKEKAFVQVDSGLFQHQPLQPVFVKPQPAAVHPDQIRAFGPDHGDLRDAPGHVFFQVAQVALQVVQHLREPLFPWL